MIDATARIRNLSIALKALSRINSMGKWDPCKDVRDLLREEIMQFEKENQKAGPARPAKLTADNEIPF